MKVYLTNIGQIQVSEVKYQGRGDKLYGSDGSTLDKFGSTTYENFILSQNPPTDEEIKKLKFPEGPKDDM